MNTCLRSFCLSQEKLSLTKHFNFLSRPAPPLVSFLNERLCLLLDRNKVRLSVPYDLVLISEEEWPNESEESPCVDKNGVKAHCAIIASGAEMLGGLIRFTKTVHCNSQAFCNDKPIPVRIGNSTKVDVKLLVFYLYTGYLPVPTDITDNEWESSLKRLLVLSKLYFLDDLKNICDIYLYRLVTSENCPEFFLLAEQYSLPSLRSESARLVLASISHTQHVASNELQDSEDLAVLLGMNSTENADTGSDADTGTGTCTVTGTSICDRLSESFLLEEEEADELTVNFYACCVFAFCVFACKQVLKSQ
jgi:hypothetical protein